MANFLNLFSPTDVVAREKKNLDEFAKILESLKATGKVPAEAVVTAESPQEIPVDELMGINQPKEPTEFETLIKNQGYTSDYQPNVIHRGAPQSVQERQWTQDYYNKTGRLPTQKEYGEWAVSQDKKDWEWAEDSTMRQLGFKTYDEFDKARKMGVTYGPWAGALVPEGGTVIKDEKGNPWFRTYQPEGHKGYIEKHGAIPKESAEHYPSYNRTANVPKAEEILSRPEWQIDVYKSHLSDYLDRLVIADKTKVTDAQASQQEVLDRYNSQIDGYNQKVADGELTQEMAEYYAKSIEASTKASIQNLQDIIDNAMTEDKAKQTLEDAINLVGENADISKLPFYTESQGVIGKSTTELMLRAVASETAKEEQRIKNIPSYWGEAGQQPAKPTGSEQREFLTFVEGLQTAPEWKNWLSNKYYEYYDMWSKSGSPMDFVSWVKDYIKRGG